MQFPESLFIALRKSLLCQIAFKIRIRFDRRRKLYVFARNITRLLTAASVISYLIPYDAIRSRLLTKYCNRCALGQLR